MPKHDKDSGKGKGAATFRTTFNFRRPRRSPSPEECPACRECSSDSGSADSFEELAEDIMERLEALERLVLQSNAMIQDMSRRLAALESHTHAVLHAVNE